MLKRTVQVNSLWFLYLFAYRSESATDPVRDKMDKGLAVRCVGDKAICLPYICVLSYHEKSR